MFFVRSPLKIIQRIEFEEEVCLPRQPKENNFKIFLKKKLPQRTKVKIFSIKHLLVSEYQVCLNKS
jgi:hypothetical protein